MKIVFAFILGLALGFLAHLALFDRSTTAHHWRVVERYNAFVRDPANYWIDPATGMSVSSPPRDPDPSLAALVDAGELSHVDLVFPTVPASREAQAHWMAFCEAHEEIVYAYGNPSYTDFRPNGPEPLHLNLWFRDADKEVVQTLIRELEEQYGE